MHLTAGELIAELSKLPPQTPVVIRRPTSAFQSLVTPLQKVEHVAAVDMCGFKGIGIVLEPIPLTASPDETTSWKKLHVVAFG